MEQILFIFLIFTGVGSLTASVLRKYYLVQQGKTWSNAQAYCKANYVDLAIIDSNDNMIELQNEAQRQQFGSSAWIGMYNDINSWRWSYGDEKLGNMTKWATAEPNNSGGKQTCVAIKPSGWTDRNCPEANPSWCFDGSSYVYVSALKNWSEAQSYCRLYYTDLASTRNQSEYTTIYEKTTTNTWIGLFRDSWKWIDQTNFSTISWMPGKPDNVKTKENCGYLNIIQVSDAQCSYVMPFYCYSIITATQIIKVKVQSSQDVNDPALKEDILKQITQKLNSFGMAQRMTVKWREQSDGVVFHKYNINI